MTMKHFKGLAFLLSFIFVLTAGGITAFAVNNGPDESDSSYAYLLFHKVDGSNTYLYVSANQTTSTGKIAGAVYDKSSNTLTLTDCNQPGYTIETNMMGDDFKISLKGTNSIQGLSVWGWGYGGSVTILGNGTLYVNKNKSIQNGIVLNPEGTKAKLTVDGLAKVYTYAGKNGYPFISKETGFTQCVDADGSIELTTEKAYSEKNVTKTYSRISSYDITSDNVYKKDGEDSLYWKDTRYCETTYIGETLIETRCRVYKLEKMSYGNLYYKGESSMVVADAEQNLPDEYTLSRVKINVLDTVDYEVYTRENDDNLYYIEEYTSIDMNDTDPVEVDKHRIYRLIPFFDSTAYCTDKVSDEDGKFDPEKEGYTKSDEKKNIIVSPSEGKADVYKNVETGEICYFDALYENDVYAYTKLDMSKLADVTDASGNEKEIYIAISSSDNERYDLPYYNNKEFTDKYEAETIRIYYDDLYNVFADGDEYVLKATDAQECAHSSKISKVTSKATVTKDGVITTYCKDCGEKLSTSRIAKVSTVKLSTTACTYNGKVRTPSVVVKNSAGKALVKNKDYKLTYAAGRKNVGRYTVKVTFAGTRYAGSKILTFDINPKGTSIAATAAGKGSLSVRWNKQTTQTSGYQIQYSANKAFNSGTAIKTMAKNSTVRTSVTKLKSGKTYYVRVRTYKTVTVNGKAVKLYSAWSKAASVKVK